MIPFSHRLLLRTQTGLWTVHTPYFDLSITPHRFWVVAVPRTYTLEYMEKTPENSWRPKRGFCASIPYLWNKHNTPLGHLVFEIMKLWKQIMSLNNYSFVQSELFRINESISNLKMFYRSIFLCFLNQKLKIQDCSMWFHVMQISISIQVSQSILLETCEGINDNEKNLLRGLILRVCCKQGMRPHAEQHRIKI